MIDTCWLNNCASVLMPMCSCLPSCVLPFLIIFIVVIFLLVSPLLCLLSLSILLLSSIILPSSTPPYSSDSPKFSSLSSSVILCLISPPYHSLCFSFSSLIFLFPRLPPKPPLFPHLNFSGFANLFLSFYFSSPSPLV